MDWPTQRVENIPADEFVPPHCPDAGCPSNRETDPVPFRCIRKGWYRRQAAPHRVRRYLCTVCGRGFSQQTFAVSYYLKHPERLVPCAAGLCAGSSFGQIADVHGGHRSSWARLSERIGRHAMLLHALVLEEIRARRLLVEPLVYDHLETFAACQDYPIGIGLLALKESRFVLSVDAAMHARPRRLPWERARRDSRYRRWGRPPRGAYARAVAATRDRLLAISAPDVRLRLATDAHPAYRRFDRSPRIERAVHPNPPRRRGGPRSAEVRERHRQLWLADVLDKLVRHETAGHKRETIAFMRRHACLVLRVFVNVVRRNLVAPRSKRAGRAQAHVTPAVRLGVVDERWSWSRIFAQRIFPHRIALPDDWAAIYDKRLNTPMVGKNTTHRLRYAY
ncbi:MAG: hypothetical protein D6738_10600 [Acidobacteria bacterium]|nr:MAG: hypothetical protein D6738_10600 [Acidobacteriota bacterium]